MLSKKYAPNTQKSLFHKNIVNHIRKWIVNIEACAEEPGHSLKHLLLVTGPVGCGKSTSMSILLKGFNVIDIDPTEVRSSEKILDLANTIPGFGEQTLANIEKWNHKNKKDKPNVVVVDNIELCEKSIVNFVDIVHCKRNINVPIVLIGNNPKLIDSFNGSANFTFIEFNKPSLLEISKLVADLNTAEDMRLDHNSIQAVVQKSEFDVRQVFHILEQWKISSKPFDDFILSVSQKHVDTDLDVKVAYLLDTSIPFGPLDYLYSNTEPLVISNGLYQNYLTALAISENTDVRNITSTTAKIMDEISIGDTMQRKLFEDQCWEMYDNVGLQSNVLPSFAIKRLCLQNPKGNKKLSHMMTPFKDISYNYINSFEEVKRNCIHNHFDPKFNKKHTNTSNGIYNADTNMCFDIVKAFLIQITIVTQYFDKQKRGKNTSKQEKLDICNNITDNNVQYVLDNLVDKIYHYHLFEIDIDNVIVNKKEYLKEEVQKKEYTRIELRMLKRFLNIFSFHDTTKFIKPHVEAAMKYKLFQKTVQNVHDPHQIANNPKIINNNIESLTADLSNIWKF
jgi:DNA polymerase III delta prime subunit